MRELFIYYRSEVHEAERVAQLVAAFQARLMGQRPALRARLLRRPEIHAERITWMETYSINDAPRHPEGIDAELQSTIEEAAQALLEFVDGPRHVEVFETCAC